MGCDILHTWLKDDRNLMKVFADDTGAESYKQQVKQFGASEKCKITPYEIQRAKLIKRIAPFAAGPKPFDQYKWWHGLLPTAGPGGKENAELQ